MVLCLQCPAVSLTSAQQRVYSRQRRDSVRIGALELDAMDQREISGAILQKEVSYKRQFLCRTVAACSEGYGKCC